VGCVRLVYSKALDARTRATQRRCITYGQTSAMLTECKRDPDLVFLGDVSSVPLQQELRHLQAAFAAFFANRAKARLKVARIHARIADRRRDHPHKLTSRLVRDNQTVVIEDLSVRNLLRNHRLARAISDASSSQLRTMLEYKTRWYGRRLVVIDRWLPSSKLCSTCGRPAGSMPLDMREWACACGAIHDRDVNAARNILAAGLADSNACGVDVRPQGSSPGGRSAVKQEPPRVTMGIPAL
jgi:putative transposase